MIHDHPHHAHGPGGHDAAHRQGRLGERRRVLVVLAITAVVLVAEVVGGFASGSLALLSDAGHMLSDVAAQVLSLVALAIAARPANVRRTFGYHRVEILAALANGVALIGLSVWIVWSAVHRLREGQGEVHTSLMISVAAVGLVANLVSAWILHGAGSLNVRGAYLHVLMDSLSSVAVLAGGAVMAIAGGFYAIDPILSMAIGLFVNWSAYRLVRDAIDVLLETVPAGIDAEGVGRAMAGCRGVRGVHDLHIWTITSGMHALSAHVVVDTKDLRGSDAVLTEVTELLLRDFRIAHSTIQIESREWEHVGPSCTHQPEGA